MSPWTPLCREVDKIIPAPPLRLLIDGETYDAPAGYTIEVDRERPDRVTLVCAVPVPTDAVTVVDEGDPVTFHGTTQVASDWQHPRFTGTAWLP